MEFTTQFKVQNEYTFDANQMGAACNKITMGLSALAILGSIDTNNRELLQDIAGDIIQAVAILDDDLAEQIIEQSRQSGIEIMNAVKEHFEAKGEVN